MFIEEPKMEEEIEIKPYFSSLDEVVEILIEYKRVGKKAFCDFNGTKLHSDNVTLDSAYIAVCGCTKEEHEKKLKEEYERLNKMMEELEKRAVARIPSQIERGTKLIYPQRMEKWEKLVTIRATDMYYGGDVENALELMQAIEDGKSIEELKEILKSQGHSGFSQSVVRKYVMEFSKKGYQFYIATHYGQWRKEEIAYLRRILEQNSEYSKEEYKAKIKTKAV